MATHAKHAIPGKKVGGARPNSGRPKGATNVLPYRGIKAIKSLRLRVPDDAPDEIKELADRAFQRVADVMNCKVSYKQSNSVLKAAVHIREEICGPITRKVEVEGKIGIAALLDEVSNIEKEEREAVEIDTVKLPEKPKLIGPIVRRKAANVVIATEVAAALDPKEDEE